LNDWPETGNLSETELKNWERKAGRFCSIWMGDITHEGLFGFAYFDTQWSFHTPQPQF
jgi:hypothetical protein